MRPSTKRITIIGVVLLAAMQVIRPARVNPPTDTTRTVEAVMSTDSPGLRVIDRSCRDCHSNNTTWPWYSNVAPVSWLISHDVVEGRRAVNFSEWASYGPEQRRKLLKKSCDEATEGEMPLTIYVLLHGTAKLTPGDIEAVCSLTQIELAQSGSRGSEFRDR
jgi:hypothetical protein